MLKIDILKWANSPLLLQNPEEAVKEFMEEKPIMSEMEQKIKYYQVTIATVENAIVMRLLYHIHKNSLWFYCKYSFMIKNT